MAKNERFKRDGYTAVFVKKFELHRAEIRLRPSGVDYELYLANRLGSQSAGFSRSYFDDEMVVNHYYYESEVDLFEQTVEFALNAHRSPDDLKVRFFYPVGIPRGGREPSELAEIRSAIGQAMTDTERGAFGW
jgi:hypothetical protein